MDSHPPNSDESQALNDQDQTIIKMIQLGLPEELICASTGASQLKVSRLISQTKVEPIKSSFSAFGRQQITPPCRKIFKHSPPNENPVLSQSQQEASHQAYIYTCRRHSCRLFATKFSTKQTTKIKLPSILFAENVSYLVMLPTGKIFIPYIKISKRFYYFDSDHSVECEDHFKTALVIDPFKEFAVLETPKLPSIRNDYVAIYHSSYVYVIGGSNYTLRSIIASDECDRFDCRTNCWETLAPLPQECCQASVVETSNCLFVLGGYGIDEYSKKILKTLIQRLNLNSMDWDVLPIKLPSPQANISCFSKNSKVYLVVNRALYSFTPDSIKLIRSVRFYPSAECGPSYLYKTTLFCTRSSSPARIYELGEIEASKTRFS